MHKEERQRYRVPVDYEVVAYWEAGGQVYTTRPRVRDASDDGLRLESAVPIDFGIQVCLDLPNSPSACEAVVRYCLPEAGGYRIGVQFSSASPHSRPASQV